MVIEQFAQLGRTAKEPKLITAFVAAILKVTVLAEAIGPHVTRHTPAIKANLPIAPDLYEKFAIGGDLLRGGKTAGNLVVVHLDAQLARN